MNIYKIGESLEIQYKGAGSALACLAGWGVSSTT